MSALLTRPGAAWTESAHISTARKWPWPAGWLKMDIRPKGCCSSPFRRKQKFDGLTKDWLTLQSRRLKALCLRVLREEPFFLSSGRVVRSLSEWRRLESPFPKWMPQNKLAASTITLERSCSFVAPLLQLWIPAAERARRLS